MKSLQVVAAVACALLATPAMAEDGHDLSGLKLGVFAGYEESGLSGGDAGQRADGMMFGATVGYDLGVGPVILGVDAEWAESTTKHELHDVSLPGDSMTSSSGRDVYIGAKLGVVPVERMMVYAKVGAVKSKAQVVWEYSPYIAYSNIEMDGIRYSAGAEYMVSDRIGIRAEYRHSDLDFEDGNGVETGSYRDQGVLGVFARF